MTPELRQWLLECPTLLGISALTLDAAACGLIDLADELPRAIAADVRLRTGFARIPLRLSHAGFALARARRLRWCRIDMAGCTAVLSGPVGSGAVLVEANGHALLEIDAEIPSTIVAAMAGRPLSALLTCPVLDRRAYTVSDASTESGRTQLRFDVPAFPIARLKAAAARSSRAS
jgi:hypothetical protein